MSFFSSWLCQCHALENDKLNAPAQSFPPFIIELLIFKLFVLDCVEHQQNKALIALIVLNQFFSKSTYG